MYCWSYIVNVCIRLITCNSHLSPQFGCLNCITINHQSKSQWLCVLLFDDKTHGYRMAPNVICDFTKMSDLNSRQLVLWRRRVFRRHRKSRVKLVITGGIPKDCKHWKRERKCAVPSYGRITEDSVVRLR